jgi:hypothetical protein
MFAFLGLESPLHWLILLLIGLFFLAVPATVVVVVLMAMKRNTGRPSRNLVLCPDCGNKVSRLAKSCPHCGRPFVAEPAS